MIISGYITVMNKVESLVAFKNLLYHASQKIQTPIDISQYNMLRNQYPTEYYTAD